MTRAIALLRAVNVGGHIVRMAQLRKTFEDLGFTRVETFIASGNVIFDSARPVTKSAIGAIERALAAACRFEVATFVRSDREFASVAAFAPFAAEDLSHALALNVGFLADPLDARARARVMALRSDIDEFRVNGREVYWLCRRRQSESSFSNAVLERAIGRQATFRGVNTVRKIAAKYCRLAVPEEK